MTKITILVAATTILLGCGDDGSKLLGVYSLDTWTENDASCDAEGPSVLESSGSTHFFVKEVSFFGTTFLNAALCPDLADCQQRAAESDTIELGDSSYGFDSGSDSAGWTGGGTIAGGSGDSCSGEVFDYVLTDEGEGMVRIRVETREVSGFPTDSDGFCDTDAAREAAAEQPCDRLEVLTGTLLEMI